MPQLLFSNNESWKKKQTESCFDVTMESFDGAEVCKLVGIYIFCFLKIADFLDIMFNLNNGRYRPYKNPKDLLLYINKSLTHPPQIINQLPKIINERLSRNSSDEEVFHSFKYQYEQALRDSGYTDLELKFNKISSSHTSFGLIRLSAEQSPKMLKKGFSKYYITTSHPPTCFIKNLIRTQ